MGRCRGRGSPIHLPHLPLPTYPPPPYFPATLLPVCALRPYAPCPTIVLSTPSADPTALHSHLTPRLPALPRTPRIPCPPAFLLPTLCPMHRRALTPRIPVCVPSPTADYPHHPLHYPLIPCLSRYPLHVIPFAACGALCHPPPVLPRPTALPPIKRTNFCAPYAVSLSRILSRLPPYPTCAAASDQAGFRRPPERRSRLR